MCRQHPTLGNQPTPEHKQDSHDHHHNDDDDHNHQEVQYHGDDHNHDEVHDHDDDDPNLIGESGVEIRKLCDHQQPRRRTLSKLFKVLLVKHLAQLVVTSVFKCVGQLMVVVVSVVVSVVVIVVVVAVAVVVDVVVVVLLLQILIVVAQLEA